MLPRIHSFSFLPKKQTVNSSVVERTSLSNKVDLSWILLHLVDFCKYFIYGCLDSFLGWYFPMHFHALLHTNFFFGKIRKKYWLK